MKTTQNQIDYRVNAASFDATTVEISLISDRARQPYGPACVSVNVYKSALPAVIDRFDAAGLIGEIR